tara:strand:- start:187 stop:450 length:264 start_codon:yes stop_codon:yes gene_type:complete
VKNNHVINLHGDYESMNDVIEKLNHELYLEAQAHNKEVKDSMLVATAYIAIGTRILRTVMDKENYKRLMNNIVEEDVEPFNVNKTIN